MLSSKYFKFSTVASYNFRSQIQSAEKLEQQVSNTKILLQDKHDWPKVAVVDVCNNKQQNKIVGKQELYKKRTSRAR